MYWKSFPASLSKFGTIVGPGKRHGWLGCLVLMCWSTRKCIILTAGSSLDGEESVWIVDCGVHLVWLCECQCSVQSESGPNGGCVAHCRSVHTRSPRGGSVVHRACDYFNCEHLRPTKRLESQP